MEDGQPPSYNDDDFTAFIPFANESNNCFTKVVRLKIQVPRYHGYRGPYNKHVYEHCPPMDTGSTGLLISAIDLGYTEESQLQEHEKGMEYLSSSRNYYEGYWVPTKVIFPDGNVSADIKILTVTYSGVCAKFNDSTGICEELVKSTAGSRSGSFPRGIFYLGVGFGRLSTQQPGGTADKNPLLNVVATNDGVALSGSGLHQGYVITQTGVWVGLTKSNTKGFSNSKLSPYSGTLPTGPLKEWNGTNAFLDYHEDRNMQGTVLFDTGVSQSYLSGPAFPSKKNHTLARGDRYTIKIGNETDVPLEILDMTVGDVANPITPSSVKAKRRENAFINTGRFFFRSFDVLLDAKEGWLGLRKHEPCNPSSASNL
ncbi:hypothetical protein H2200_004171 [Cladophialophora chaetospira]|uniref:Uncharacterized protein n=1 Tax=Cladophialophora chaetospira TaxID=386627 RepID=A0AA39CKN0_9EURO|nr:hypothetical protein H2200_004171 [Cladophialophora chaetospira]